MKANSFFFDSKYALGFHFQVCRGWLVHNHILSLGVTACQTRDERMVTHQTPQRIEQRAPAGVSPYFANKLPQVENVSPFYDVIIKSCFTKYNFGFDCGKNYPRIHKCISIKVVDIFILGLLQTSIFQPQFGIRAWH